MKTLHHFFVQFHLILNFDFTRLTLKHKIDL